MNASGERLDIDTMLEHRSLTSEDQDQLWEWLHLSLWDPPPAAPRPRTVLQNPEVRVYAEGWGRDGDVGVVGIVDEVEIGACWMRPLLAEVGLAWVDEQTPQLGIAVLPRHRRLGYGTRLLQAALAAASHAGFHQVSLTVHPANPAITLYERCGFAKRGLRRGFHLMIYDEGSRAGFHSLAGAQ